MQTLSAALGNASTAKVTTVKAIPSVLSNDTSGFAPAIAAAKAADQVVLYLGIDGTVEGDIRLPEHVLTIGPNGQVSGSIHAKTIQILGNVKGDVGASERVEIESSGVVEGDLRAPRLLVQEGAVVNGSIEMTSGTSSKSALPHGDKGEKTVQAV